MAKVNHKYQVLVIDGIIGAGKSTLLQILEKYLISKGLRVTIINEPVNKWQENGLLQRFYEGQTIKTSYSYQFETAAFLDKSSQALKYFNEYKDCTDIFIMERSIF